MATRTWVSGVGDDANPGSRTAPCKTFAGAISKTDPGGEIDALDPGGFGALTITKSITIDGSGTFASVLASGTNGIVINGAGIVVTLRGLAINGSGGGISGVRIMAADKVHIEDCVIFNFTGGVARGIDDLRSTGTLTVARTTVRDCAQSGIVVRSSAGSVIQAFLDQVSVYGHGNAGIIASNNSRVTVGRSLIAWNQAHGVFAESTTGTSECAVETCLVLANGHGVHADPGSTVRISNNQITGCTTGLASAGGTFVTFGNNHVAGNGAGNTVPGAPPPVAPV